MKSASESTSWLGRGSLVYVGGTSKERGIVGDEGRVLESGDDGSTVVERRLREGHQVGPTRSKVRCDSVYVNNAIGLPAIYLV